MRSFQVNPQWEGLTKTIEQENPPCKYEIHGMSEAMVSMRDGVQLHTRIYRPNQGDSWPCILVRNPYPNNQDLLEATYTQFVRHGYVLVIQSCRGTGLSEGEWSPFVNEREDGIDTLEWLVQQSFQNGNIALFGQSYCSFTTWIIADSFPKEVKTVFLDLFGVDRYGQMYMNGMFRHDIYTSWAFANSGVETTTDAGELYQDSLSILPHNQADEKLLGRTLPFYQSYISETSRESKYWQDGIWAELLNIPAKINIPVFMVEGWFDHHLEGAFKGYNLLQDHVKRKSRFVVGPWDHVGNSPGERTYPDANLLGAFRIKAALEWFDIHLKGNPGTFSPISFYRIGASRWEERQSITDQDTTWRLYFSNNPEQQLTDKPSQPSTVKYVYDPSSPVPTHGGSALLAWIMPSFKGAPHGSLAQPDFSDRQDVLRFDSAVLDENTQITGGIKVCLEVSTDAEDTAFSVKICEVFPDGQSFNIVDGITSLRYRNNIDQPVDYTPNQPVQVIIEMWPTAWELQKGSFIRAEVSSSNFPAYHVHSNVKEPWASTSKYKIAAQTLYTGSNYCSYIEFPK
ncbi:CocE/NonD family hydrolase [Paenibacillus sp. FSL K6-1558]|uniref:CocE/NonD family hydrolase n=1 Tax=Paenibacillus sp. FSL K6-1558 TaxID=2921473 RepID=UPI0012B7CF2A|nr:CocE/NonD family hydrolase [Paenibacillus xylanexedens]